MASSATSLKRPHPDAPVSNFPVPNTHLSPNAKRVRRTVTTPNTIATILRSDNPVPSKYALRLSFLQSLHIPESAVLGLLQGLSNEAAAFLAIVDLNLYRDNLLQIISDFSNRGVSISTLNVKAHAFIMNEKQGVLNSFKSFYGHQAWPCRVAEYIAGTVFGEETAISINVMSGGGVRDVLIADWCTFYYKTPTPTPPQIILLTAPSGAVFLIPFIP
ncbi:unnamed protein product [Chondrus crispus]|uniref:Uncharacterized protein n=1 Tax=Chondrus crispus TaxID=2769 RepID=R7QKA2_CHOCR|nr:unnamed protein product [Chondrus crispus]CDF37835.1 unnamed protein product [Chondrus crispus]|eukprot:XP_005717706.1 unnamed protein product [Chondrus crispus]